METPKDATTHAEMLSLTQAESAAGGGFINLLQHPNLNRRNEVTPGVLENESRTLLLDFFGKRRK